MTNDPKAGQGIDAEILAAYIERRLSPEQRAAVEAQLAKDPDSYTVLVESMKALDEIEVPQVPKVRARRWVIAAGALAAAAAIALVVWTQPDLLRRLRGQPVESQLERLVSAVGKERYFEPRLTGGFEFGPLRSESRGQGSANENLALVAAAAELQKQAEGARRAATLRGWGIAQLLLRDYDAAVTTLREAIDIEPTAQSQSDLAAAQLARADGQGSTADLPAALDAATTALQIDPRLAEAHYNRALALERLGLSDQAASEWREYLEVDAAGPWADEARARLSRLGSAQFNVDPYAPWSPGVAFARAGDQNLDLARIRFLAERDWFVRLCDTQLSRPDREQLAERIAAFTRATDDRLLLEVLNAGTSAGTCDGYRSYAKAAALLDDDNLTEGGKSMRSAARLLHAGNNPLGWWADYHLASILNVTRQFADAERELTRIASTANAHHYRALEAHALWTLGVVRGSTDRFRESLLVLIPAVDQAAQSAEPVLEGRLQNQIADIYEYLGLTRSAWPHRKAAWAIAAKVPNRRLRHSVYGSMVAVSARRHLPHTTRAFLEAQYQANLIGAPPTARLTLLLRQIEADLSTRDLDAAAVRLQQADAALALLSQDPRLETLEGRVRLAKARHALYQAQPAAAVDLATDALRAFTRGREMQKADALLLRARALQQSGRGREALDDIGGVLTTLHERRGSGESLFGTPELQDVKDGIDELLDGDIDVESALALTDALAGVIAPAATTPRGVAGGDTLCFKVLDSRIRAWWITPRGVTERSLPLTRADAVRLVKSVQFAIAGTDGADARRRLESAYGSLLAPFRDDITGAASFRIVADWPLDSIPFSALLDPVTHRFVAEDHAVAFAPAVTGFHQPVGERPRDVDLLVVADPSRTYADDGLVPLKWAAKEADAVSRLYSRTVVLRGQEATPKELFRHAPQARVVHVAAHAIVDRTDGRRSRLLLSGSNGEGDVFGEEFVNQKWSGIDVVVLAACATAEADARPASPLTLATQVLAAGPRFVIATLKPIDDRLASIFFVELHRLLATGVPAPEAVQRAQIHFIEQGRSPMAGDVGMWSMWTPVAVFSL